MMTKQRKFDAVKRRVGSIDLEVCRRDDRFGTGPCFSVHRHGREVLRFDLFPAGAHWHSYREPNQPRRYFARDGSTWCPAAPDIESGARHAASPPWDVLVRSAWCIAAREYPQLVDETVRAWLYAELDKRYAK